MRDLQTGGLNYFKSAALECTELARSAKIPKFLHSRDSVDTPVQAI